MPVRVLTRKTLAVTIVVVCALTAAHAEWTHWRGPNQDGSSAETFSSARQPVERSSSTCRCASLARGESGYSFSTLSNAFSAASP